MEFINYLKNKIKKSNKKAIIIFPEGDNSFVRQVAQKLESEGFVSPLLVTKNNLKGVKTISIDDINIEEYAQKLVEIRKNKITFDEAKKLISQNNYFATMLLKMGHADGFVGGIDYKTSDILRAGFQIIKKIPESSLATSCMLMLKNNEFYVFGDISVTPNPSSENLADISLLIANFMKKTLAIDPKISLLSFSTNGSAVTDESKKVSEAYNLLLKKDIPYEIQGEVQFDVGWSEEIRRKKAPHFNLKGRSNLYIFPNLDSGNIGYKIAERMGSFTTIGPIIIGMNKPFNDLSRGSSPESIYLVSLITALQCISNDK